MRAQVELQVLVSRAENVLHLKEKERDLVVKKAALEAKIKMLEGRLDDSPEGSGDGGEGPSGGGSSAPP